MREIPIILNNLNNNLNMKKFVLLTLMLLVLVSCKDETSSDVNDIDNLNIETETNDNSFAKEIIDNFPIERSSVIGFENLVKVVAMDLLLRLNLHLKIIRKK